MIQVLIFAIALEHIGFMVLEMLLWQKPIGLKVFRMTQDMAKASATLAMNQGLYNGFLAAGLLFLPTQSAFFLSCVFVAGIFGAITVNKRIALVQALPAAIALVLQWLHA